MSQSTTTKIKCQSFTSQFLIHNNSVQLNDARIKEQVAISKMNVNEENNIKTDNNSNNNNLKTEEKSSCIERSLHILNIANLKYFTELQKSQLFSIKAEIKHVQKLQSLDDSNASYSSSLAIAGDNWKAWTKWSDFCDSIYSAKHDYRWAMYAMITYLCSLHGGDELTRAYWPDNLMNPIHPNYPKNNHAHHAHNKYHSPFGIGERHNNNTEDVLQKHGDPEKDLQHSNYHHLVIPRILMLIQAAKIGPEDDDNNNNNNESKDNNTNKTKKDKMNETHIDANGEQKTIHTRENSEFIRYLYDGVMKLPSHVFLGYIPQLISGLYRYENGCVLSDIK